MERNDRPSRRRVKESLARLLATTAGTLLVAAGAGRTPAAEASVAPAAPAPVAERARELRQSDAAPLEAKSAAAPPTRLAWWGNWHNGGWHPYWHNWPNWRNWHNWHNWGNY